MHHEPVRPFKPVPAGYVLRRELAARGWKQRDLAAVMGRPAQAINEIIRGRKRITPETATELSAAMGMSAISWLRLDASYWLESLETDPASAASCRAIRQRARELERRLARERGAAGRNAARRTGGRDA